MLHRVFYQIAGNRYFFNDASQAMWSRSTASGAMGALLMLRYCWHSGVSTACRSLCVVEQEVVRSVAIRATEVDKERQCMSGSLK
jgi:hypothetical protein